MLKCIGARIRLPRSQDTVAIVCLKLGESRLFRVPSPVVGIGEGDDGRVPRPSL
jgi:hypothetical protein